jgi:hypothetical protein
MRKAAAFSGIPLTTLTVWTHKKSKRCIYMEEGYLPTTPRVPPPPFGGSAEKTVFLEDLNQLVEGMRRAKCQPSVLTPNDGLMTVEEIAHHFELCDHWEKSQLGVLLCRLDESCQIHRQKTCRYSKKRKQNYRPYGYQLTEFAPLLGNRSIRDILREMVPKFGIYPIVLQQGRLRFHHEPHQENEENTTEPSTLQASASQTAPSANQKTQPPRIDAHRQPIEREEPSWHIHNSPERPLYVCNVPPPAGVKIIPPEEKDWIIALGNNQYQINGSDPFCVNDREDFLLQAFLKQASMSQQVLSEKTKISDAPRVFASLMKKCDGILAPAMRSPNGKKDQGGYFVRIKLPTSGKVIPN